LSSRHFEPDKATTLRGIVVVMAAAGIIRALERLDARLARRQEPAAPSGSLLGRLWHRLNSIPLALPTLGYALVFRFTTTPLVVPFALYRAIGALHEARRAPTTSQPGADWGWAAAYTLLVLGSLGPIFGAIEFGAVVHNPTGLDYWWVYPGALIVAFFLYLVP